MSHEEGEAFLKAVDQNDLDHVTAFMTRWKEAMDGTGRFLMRDYADEVFDKAAAKAAKKGQLEMFKVIDHKVPKSLVLYLVINQQWEVVKYLKSVNKIEPYSGFDKISVFATLLNLKSKREVTRIVSYMKAEYPEDFTDAFVDEVMKDLDPFLDCLV